MDRVLNDSEEQRSLDRIYYMSYREIRDKMIAKTGDSLIIRQWISEKLHHDKSSVPHTWNKAAEECYTMVDLRYTLKRTKTLLLLQVMSGAAVLEKLQEKFWRKRERN